MARTCRYLLLIFSLALCPPSVAQDGGLALIAPTAGQRIQQLETLKIVVRADAAVATRTVSLSINGTVAQTLSTPAPWRELTIPWAIGERTPGEYTIRVSAQGAGAARWQSPAIRVVVTPAPWYPAPRDRSYALLIGVGQYQDTGITALTFSSADVDAMYRTLTDPAAGAYPPQNVVRMTDEMPEDRRPTRNNILDLLKNWLGKVGKNADSVLVYFSGHGIEENGKGYLVPRDARIGILSDTAVDLERVNQLLADTGAKVKLLVVDACHSAAGKGTRLQMPSAVASGLFADAEGRATLASCKEDQRSWEWPEKGQSVFTYYLVEALQGAADANRDGHVTLAEANAYVYRKVKEWAVKNRKEQEPRLKADVSGEVVLAGFEPGKAPIRRPGVVAMGPRPETEPVTPALPAQGASGQATPATLGRAKVWRIDAQGRLVDALGRPLLPPAVATVYPDGGDIVTPCDQLADAAAQHGVELIWVQLHTMRISTGDPGPELAGGITRVDELVRALRVRGIRCILVPAIQQSGPRYVTGPSAALWTSAASQASYLSLVAALARRYKDDGDIVIGMALLTDPDPPSTVVWERLAAKAADRIREEDPDMPLFFTPPFGKQGEWSLPLPDNAMIGGWAIPADDTSLMQRLVPPEGSAFVVVDSVPGAQDKRVLPALQRGLIPCLWCPDALLKRSPSTFLEEFRKAVQQHKASFAGAAAPSATDETQFQGIGAYLKMAGDGKRVLLAPVAGGPAAQAGLKLNDILLRIDTTDAAGITIDRVKELIRGPAGTIVKVTVGRLADPSKPQAADNPMKSVVLTIKRDTMRPATMPPEPAWPGGRQ